VVAPTPTFMYHYQKPGAQFITYKVCYSTTVMISLLEQERTLITRTVVDGTLTTLVAGFTFHTNPMDIITHIESPPLHFIRRPPL